jgi:hypothetical protein
MNSRLFPCLAFFFFCSLLPGQAGLLDGLTAAQKARVEAGEIVYVPQTVAQMPWPRAVVYRFVAASPKEVMAVFTNYNSASEFVPNVVKSSILRTVSPGQQEVRYELSVPLLPNEIYIATNTLSSHQGGALLEVSWRAGEARYFRSSVGKLEVAPHGAGSVIRYTNLVDPGTRFASILKGTAEKQIKETVNAIAQRVSHLKTNDPAELARQVQTLERTLRQLPNK